MVRVKFVFSVYIFLIICALGGIFYFNKSNGQIASDQAPEGSVAGVQSDQPEGYVERLVKALAKEGMVLYGSSLSEESKKQKELFGQSAKYLDYVECDPSGENAFPEECVAKQIAEYPTWVFQDTKLEGVQELGELAKVINFSE